MSAWVLVIVNTSVISIDMPDKTACYLALNKALLDRYVVSAFCLTRNP